MFSNNDQRMQHTTALPHYHCFLVSYITTYWLLRVRLSWNFPNKKTKKIYPNTWHTMVMKYSGLRPYEAVWTTWWFTYSLKGKEVKVWENSVQHKATKPLFTKSKAATQGFGHVQNVSNDVQPKLKSDGHLLNPGPSGVHVPQRTTLLILSVCYRGVWLLNF